MQPGNAWGVNSKALIKNLLSPFLNLHFNHFLLKFKLRGRDSMFKFLQKIYDVNPWKTKAMKRREEIKNLKKENKRLKDSRNKWKAKASKFERQTIELNDELKKI